MFNHYKINNFKQDSAISKPLDTLTQTVFMYPDRTLRYIHLYSKDNIPVSLQVTISQEKNTFTVSNISEYQY